MVLHWKKMFSQPFIDDLFLEDNSPKREAFIKEFESAVALMREEDFNQFYSFADIIMQKYG